MSPAVENTLSLATLVACTARYRLASLDKCGYWCSLSFHHFSGFESTEITLTILYSLISSFTTSGHGLVADDDAVEAVLKESPNSSLSAVLFAGGVPPLVATVSGSSTGFWLDPSLEA